MEGNLSTMSTPDRPNTHEGLRRPVCAHRPSQCAPSLPGSPAPTRDSRRTPTAARPCAGRPLPPVLSRRCCAVARALQGQKYFPISQVKNISTFPPTSTSGPHFALAREEAAPAMLAGHGTASRPDAVREATADPGAPVNLVGRRERLFLAAAACACAAVVMVGAVTSDSAGPRPSEEGGGEGGGGGGENSIKDLERRARLTVAWSRHRSPVPR